MLTAKPSADSDQFVAKVFFLNVEKRCHLKIRRKLIIFPAQGVTTINSVKK